jgi:hypothetical protein
MVTSICGEYPWWNKGAEASTYSSAKWCIPFLRDDKQAGDSFRRSIVVNRKRFVQFERSERML